MFLDAAAAQAIAEKILSRSKVDACVVKIDGDAFLMIKPLENGSLAVGLCNRGEIEREITACFPPEEWTDLSHRLILHGRAICHARKPDCLNCPLNDTCPSAFAA